MASTRYHCHMSVRGALRKGKAEFNRMARSMTTSYGKRMTGESVREWLMDELAQGHEAYPMGACDNFDWKTGCKGHPLEVCNG